MARIGGPPLTHCREHEREKHATFLAALASRRAVMMEDFY